MIWLAWKATAVTVASIGISLAICSVALALLGGTLDWLAITMCVLCPLAISWPVTFFSGLQKQRLAQLNDRLRTLNAELAIAHSRLAEAHAELSERARRDSMTGLLNRETFLQSLERQRDGGGCLLLIDADNFKLVNDLHGHAAGDEALTRVAQALRCALQADDLAGRIGGEEFGIFLAHEPGRDMVAVAETIRAAVEEIDFRVEGTKVQLTVSIGVAVDQAGMMLRDLMRAADRSLYQAKRSGRNRVAVHRARRAA